MYAYKQCQSWAMDEITYGPATMPFSTLATPCSDCLCLSLKRLKFLKPADVILGI